MTHLPWYAGGFRVIRMCGGSAEDSTLVMNFDDLTCEQCRKKYDELFPEGAP